MTSNRALALGATVALAAGSWLAPAVASAASPHAASTAALQETDITSGVLPITSSTDQKLDLSVTFDATPPSTGTCGTYDTEDLGITVGTPSGRESHSWDFPSIPCTDYTPDATTPGDATITVPSTDLGPFGALSLTFTEASSKTEACSKGTPDTEYTGTLTGTIEFKTGSSWGVLGDDTTSIAFPKPDTLDDSYGCESDEIGVDDTTQACGSYSGYDIDNSKFPLVSASGAVVGKKSFGIQAFRISELSAPAEASRFDNITTTAPSPTFTAKDKGKEQVVAVTTKGDDNSGSATLTTTGKAKVSKETCLAGKTKKKEAEQDWSKVSFKNGKKPLKIGAEVFGAITFTSKDTSDVFIAKAP